MAEIGVVAIGRNEGERLQRCLESLIRQVRAVVYVDSNSTDGSVERATALGVEVVRLDMSKPFSAARARNEGFARLRQLHPEIEFVLFVDGDCEVVAGFLDSALAELAAHKDVAVVCGRRRERFPDATVYNRLCDMEWDTRVGEADACGGDALMRVAALGEVGLYNPALIAGEEPELCHRLRAAGWKVRRIDADMTLHDAAMTRFGQWWKRNLRAGFAFASNYTLTKTSPRPIWGREYRSNWLWGVALLLLPLPAYPLLAWRIYRHRRRGGDAPRAARLYAFFTTLGKIPQMFGQLRYHRLRQRATLIEYK
jgi:glycosyltransferase involved in cell wall biosynthesis